MDNTLLFTFARFAGLNDIDQSFRVPSSRDAQYSILNDMGDLQNLDIDNQYVLSTRKGGVKKLSSTTIHSMWSDNKTCLFVDYSTLSYLNVDYSKISLGVIGTGHVSYAPVNDRVYLTNQSYIGYYKDLTLNALVDPAKTYKLPLPAGQFIAYYKGRIYVAKGKVLYVSDALCDHYDIRTGFRVFNDDITLLIAVDDGLYVADGNTWFLPGDEPDLFAKIKVLTEDAVPYTAQIINGAWLKDGVKGNYAMWVSLGGICLGDNTGNVKDLTNGRFNMPKHGIGGAAIRNMDGVVHYIATLE